MPDASSSGVANSSRSGRMLNPAQPTTTVVFSDLKEALEAAAGYQQLSVAVRQQVTAAQFRQASLEFAVRRTRDYHEIPDFLRTNMSERKYFSEMIGIGIEKLQLYPYIHSEKVVHFCRETPLTFYTTMLTELLKKEKSYDSLPNFTAVDILNLLGIGRNQYLDITKQARSKLKWKFTRSYVREYLPTSYLPSVVLSPFWRVQPVPVDSLEEARKVCESDAEFALFKALTVRDFSLFDTLMSPFRKAAATPATTTPATTLAPDGATTGGTTLGPTSGSTTPSTAVVSEGEDQSGASSAGAPGGIFAAASAGSATATPLATSPPAATAASIVESLPKGISSRAEFYAAELPFNEVNALHRHGLVFSTFEVEPSEILTVPPLERFVMNRTSDDPQEKLMYSLLTTLDDRTPLYQMGALLNVGIDQVCSAAAVYVRLGLARRKNPLVPIELQSSVRRLVVTAMAAAAVADEGADEKGQKEKKSNSTCASEEKDNTQGDHREEPTAADKGEGDEAVQAATEALTTPSKKVVQEGGDADGQDAEEGTTVKAAMVMVTPQQRKRQLRQGLTVHISKHQDPSVATAASTASEEDGHGGEVVDGEGEAVAADGGDSSPNVACSVHDTWQWLFRSSAAAADGTTQDEASPLYCGNAYSFFGSTTNSAATGGGGNTSGGCEASTNTNNEVHQGGSFAGTGAEGHPSRRVAVFFDASLTGVLMMTNLSADPSLKHHAVTMFEAGKLGESMMGRFVGLLDDAAAGIGKAEEQAQAQSFMFDETLRYFQSALSLRDVLKTLHTSKTATAVSNEKEQESETATSTNTATTTGAEESERDLLGGGGVGGTPFAVPGCDGGVELLKIESINALEPQTRYSVLCRNYGAFFVLSPVSHAPLLDVAIEGVYGPSVGMWPSAWMSLFLFQKMGRGPPSAMYRYGARINVLPGPLSASETHTCNDTGSCDDDGGGAGVVKAVLRVTTLAMDPEEFVLDSAQSLYRLNQLTVGAPIFVSKIAQHPRPYGRRRQRQRQTTGNSTSSVFAVVQTALPFTLTDSEAKGYIAEVVREETRQQQQQQQQEGSNKDHHSTEVVVVVDDSRNGGTRSTGEEKGSDESVPACRAVALYRQAVEALDVSCSVGCFTMALTVHVSNSTTNTSTSTAEAGPSSMNETNDGDVNEDVSSSSGDSHQSTVVVAVRDACILGVELGFPLQRRRCCQQILAHLPRIMTEDGFQRHTAACRALEKDLGLFVEQHTLQTADQRSRAPLMPGPLQPQGAANQLKLHGNAVNPGLPVPFHDLFFDGSAVSVVSAN